MANESGECEPVAMNSDDLLFMLYTSGSTGNPKGIAHAQAGYILYASLTHQLVFDCREDDIFGCVADIGWITGHSYVVYGPLANGITTLLFESTPIYPDPGLEFTSLLVCSELYFYCWCFVFRNRTLLGDGTAFEAHSNLHGAHCHSPTD